MNKSSKKVENEEIKNKLNDEIDVENMEIANLIKKDSEDIPKISTDINVINQIRTTGRKNKNKMIIRLCTGFAACLVLVVGTVFWYRTNTENKARELASRTVHVAKNNESRMASSDYKQFLVFLVYMGFFVLLFTGQKYWKKITERLKARENVTVLAVEHGYPIFATKEEA